MLQNLGHLQDSALTL